MTKRCLRCAGDMAGVKANAKFCSTTCRNKYNYQKKIKKSVVQHLIKSNGDNLKGVLPDDSIQSLEQKRDTIESQEPELPPLRNTIWINLNEDESEVEGKDEIKKPAQQSEIGDPPPQFLEDYKFLPNAKYADRSSLLAEREKVRTDILNKLQILGKTLKEQQQRSGNGWIMAGVAVGGGLALLDSSHETTKDASITLLDKDGNIIRSDLAKKKKKGKKKKHVPQEDSFASRMGQFVISSVLGLGLGYVAKKLTETQREADKQQKITLIKQSIAKLNDQLQNVNNAIAADKAWLENNSLFLESKQKKLNPAYTSYLKKLEANQQELAGTDEENFKPQSSKISSVKDFSLQPIQALNFEGCWKEFFDNPSTNFHCLIHGNPGEGKSTFCLWFARYLAENFGRVVYISGEEGLSQTMLNKLKFCKAEGVPRLHISGIRTGDELLQEVRPGEFHFIILDSLRDMGIDADKMKEIWEKFPNTAFIAIEQNNKKGDIYGRNDMKHSFDIVVNVVNYTAETTKNRFKQKGVSLKTAEFGKDFEKGGQGLKVIHLNLKPDEDGLDFQKIV